MIEIGDFEFCVCFKTSDIDEYGEEEITQDLFDCFKDQFSNMSWKERRMARRAMRHPIITKEKTIAQQDQSGLLEYVVVPDKHPSANLEFWKLHWGKP